MAANPFRSGIRPWTRITNAARALAMGALGAGELAVTETGKVVAGNGTTPLKNLSPFLTEAGALAGYITFDGTNLRLAGTVVPITGGGSAEIGFDTDGIPYLINGPVGSNLTVTDNGNGTATINGSTATDNSDGTYTITGSTVTDNGDGTFMVAA